MTAQLINITIGYASQFSVQGPTVVQPIVHAMYLDSRITLCGKRPLNYTITDHAGKSTTCERCLATIVVTSEPLGPKPEKGYRPRRKHPPRDPETRRAEKRQQWRETWSQSDPEVVTQREATKGLSRCWYITPKGHAALEKWATEEAERTEES